MISASLLSMMAVILGPILVQDDNTAVVEHLTRLEKKFVEATMSGDIKSVEDLLAPEFTGVDPSGREFTRADVLGNVKSPGQKIESLRHEDIRVSVFGDCAVVFAVTVMEWRENDKTVTGRFPYLRVWIKRQGKWLAVATQSGGTGR
ncbi:MAG TPA: nuclear transport factor 2 family protein [bacterium]